MASVIVFVKYNGHWNENNVYTDHETMGVLVPRETSYDGLLKILFEALELRPENHSIGIKYAFELGTSPIKILNDGAVKFYLELKKNEADKTKFPLCVDIIEEPMTVPYQGIRIPEMAVHESPDPKPVEMPPCEDPPLSFGVEYVGDNLDNQSQFHTPFVVGEEVKTRVNSVASNGSRSIVRGCSYGKSDRGIDSSNRGVTSNSATNNTNCPTSSADPLPADKVDVMSDFSPTRLRVHGIYASKKALQRHLGRFAISNHFQFKARTSNKRTLHVVCCNNDCKWTVRATKIKDTDFFQIRRYEHKHTCSMDTREGDHRQATSNLIGECIKHKFSDLVRSACKPRDIIAEIQRDYGVNMSYKKAWRSREKALKSLSGSDEEAYALLPSFSYMLQSCNPGSVIALETDEHDRFSYYFMSLAAFIQGWPHCRPVIIVDRTSLKTYYRGTLFTVCAMDANQQIFPLAFGVGNSENNDLWELFFTKLKEAIGNRDNLEIISGKHQGIINAIKKVYPNANHGYCMQYLSHNLESKFKNMTPDVHRKFVNAAEAYTYEEWSRYMDLLDLEDSGIREYLANEVGNKKWARCHFQDKRYSIMTSNNAEIMNVMGKKSVEFHIKNLLEFLRRRMQQWFYERREDAAIISTVLAKNAEDRLTDIIANSTGMIVNSSSAYEFEVVDRDNRTYIVNLEKRTCQCRKFQLDQFICAHAVAASGLRGLSVYNYVSKYYKKEELQATYAGVVHPIGSPSFWAIPDEIKMRVVKPPLGN